MKIETFTIKNYRSIKKLTIDNLSPVNVFFGKNNVGKSNILRGLHLAFYSLKNDKIFLPDTMFHNRNIYRPIEITADLILEEDFCNIEELSNTLMVEIENISSEVANTKDIFSDIIDHVQLFVDNSMSFKPVKKLRLKTYIDYNDERSDIRFSFEDLESDYRFDYGKYKILYERLKGIITKKINMQSDALTKSLLSELTSLGIPEAEFEKSLMRLSPDRPAIYHRRIIEYFDDYLDQIINKIKDPHDKQTALHILKIYKERVQQQRDKPQLKPFSNTFNIVKEYFDKISDNFILIPNKEYFPKGPLLQENENGEQIEFFDIDRFEDKLLSLIESPSKKERKLIQEFNSIFSKSYGDLGELEIRKFREKVFAIFDTGFTALPIENQGLGIQDLFLYLAHIILFDSAIIAIEEPEGGLSTENQKILYNIIEDVYLRSDKQIFISSHSEEFETPNSYIIEMEKEGTKEISRREKKKEYEEKIDEVLTKRKLREEKDHYEVLLKQVTERQMAIDILSYIEKLRDEEKIDAQKISKELGYKKEKVQEILKEITKKR